VGQQLVGDPLEDLGQLEAELRHHRLQHLMAVLPQEQIRCFGCNELVEC
jgi:hypothetical protein